MNDLIWIEISKSNLKNNIKTILKLIEKKVLLAPCVKANAYGHGLVGISKLALKYGADWLCVNSIDEARALRGAGIKEPIIIIGYIQKSELKKVFELNVKIIAYEYGIVQLLSRIASNKKKDAAIHIKIDTGMSRQGILADKAINFIKKVQALPRLKLEGIATHYANADELLNPAYFKKQLAAFCALKKELKENQIKIPYFHSSNSAATLLYPETHFNLVRPGLSIYGYYPGKSVEKICAGKSINLKSILTLKTKVAQVKTLPSGTSISYGCTFTTIRPTKVAILPIGYYDGWDRKLSNKGEVLIKGKRVKIIGRVCMNIIIVDVTDINNVIAGDEVVLMGKQGKDKITAEEVAKIVGTINYEITTRLRESIPRIYVD